MATRPTRAELEAQLAQTTALLAQFATPAAVAEVVEAKPETASDKLKAFVEAQGKSFARGGRTIWTLATLNAAVKVVKTGEAALVDVSSLGSLGKRNITSMAIGLADDGKSVITQYVYTPQA